MRVQRQTARGMAWRRRHTRILGRLVTYRTASSLRTVAFNRYEEEIHGVFVHVGRRCVSWVWPVKITGLRLTNEQMDRGVRSLIDEEESRGN